MKGEMSSANTGDFKVVTVREELWRDSDAFAKLVAHHGCR